MSLIPYPNVPQSQGVPSIPRSPKFPAAGQAVLGVLQGILWRLFQVDSRWGIFDANGKALGDPSKFAAILQTIGLGATVSTNSVQYSKETKVADFPIENGSFASYNKVEAAAEPRVVLCFTGNENERRTFLDSLDKACKSTDLYSVVTPEVTYINYSIERYDYERRSSSGTTLLKVELSLKEIRQVSAQYTQSNRLLVDKPKDVGATPQADNGKVQAKIPEKSTLIKIRDSIPGLANTASKYLQGVFQ